MPGDMIGSNMTNKQNMQGNLSSGRNSEIYIAENNDPYLNSNQDYHERMVLSNLKSGGDPRSGADRRDTHSLANPSDENVPHNKHIMSGEHVVEMANLSHELEGIQ
jgi:hypothetical protein